MSDYLTPTDLEEISLAVENPEEITSEILEEKPKRKKSSKKQESEEESKVELKGESEEVNPDSQTEPTAEQEKEKTKPTAKKHENGDFEIKLPYDKPKIKRNARGQELPHFAVSECIKNARTQFGTSPEVVSIALGEENFKGSDLITFPQAIVLVQKFLKREVK